MNTFALPSRMARMAVDRVEAVLARRGEAELARPGRPGTSRASSPRCPSCGRPARWSGRAPGTRRRPACRSCRAAAAGSTISRMVGHGVLCWVRPIAQQTIVRFEATSDPAELARSGRGRPVACRRLPCPDRLHVSRPYSSKPCVCCVDEVVVEHGARRRGPRPPAAAGPAPGTAPCRRRCGSAGTGRRCGCRGRARRAPSAGS